MRLSTRDIPGGGSSSAFPGDREADLHDRIRELEQRVEERDDLLAVAAHELRNPMHALLLQVSAALAAARRDEPDDVVQRLERIKHIVDRYVKRATILLDVARLNAGRYPLQLEGVDMADIARDVVESYAPEAAFHQSSIELEAPPELHGRWDRLAIEQILANLVANAIKYGAGAPVKLALREKDHSVAIEVTDRGIGIASEDRERIFGRFEQAAGSERGAGSGVGLWLVRNLVLAHGGEISLNSVPHRGSTFTVRLPRDATSYQNESE